MCFMCELSSNQITQLSSEELVRSLECATPKIPSLHQLVGVQCTLSHSATSQLVLDVTCS